MNKIYKNYDNVECSKYLKKETIKKIIDINMDVIKCTDSDDYI